MSDDFRLETWKTIAAFLDRDERTVKRWEEERGLPVHRLQGFSRSRVYAIRGELRAWREGPEQADGLPRADEAVAPARSRGASQAPDRAKRAGGRGLRPRFLIVAVPLALAVAVAAAFLFGGRLLDRPRLAHSPSLAAEGAYLAATLDWQQRTAESLSRAEREYRTAIVDDPHYAAAYAGLANTYNLLREYGGMADTEAYPLAKANALKAIALDETSSSAHAALGFAEYWGYWNVPKARQAFTRAVELDPDNVTAHHWYATFLSNLGEEQAALAQIEAAHRLDPRSPAIAADRGLILVSAGRGAEGMAVLHAIAEANPAFPPPLQYIADLSLLRGDDREYLGASRRLAALSRDDSKVRAADTEEQAYRRGGPRALLGLLIADRSIAYTRGRASAFDLANLHSLRGDEKEALDQLRTSADRHEAAFLEITNPNFFHRLRGSHAFDALLKELQPLDG